MQCETVTPKRALDRVVLVYRANKTFQCGIAAVSCVSHEICWQGEQTDTIRAQILSDNPHRVIFLDNEWPSELIMYIAERGDVPRSFEDTPDTTLNCPIITILAQEDETIGNIMRIEPRKFKDMMNYDSAISAQIIADHLFFSEFPSIFESYDVDNARLFRIGLLAMNKSTIHTYAHLRAIVSDWHRVMEPEQIIQFGQFIISAGDRVARDHCGHYSTLFNIPLSEFREVPPAGEDQIARVMHVRYIECANTYTRTHPIKCDFAIEYNISRDGKSMQLATLLRDGEIANITRDYFATIVREHGNITVEESVLNASIPRDIWFAHMDTLCAKWGSDVD